MMMITRQTRSSFVISAMSQCTSPAMVASFKRMSPKANGNAIGAKTLITILLRRCAASYALICRELSCKFKMVCGTISAVLTSMRRSGSKSEKQRTRSVLPSKLKTPLSWRAMKYPKTGLNWSVCTAKTRRRGLAAPASSATSKIVLHPSTCGAPWRTV